MNRDEQYMYRCIELARKGAGHVTPNPMVGAVLVHNDRIIGEGYHEMYGGPHAEVNCIKSVTDAEKHLISGATLYVSLEPCAHFGKTPPCADMIIQHRIPRVVVGCRDPFIEVDGKGIEKLENAGIQVTTAVLEAECRELNKRFFVFHLLRRPYIILKWAETGNHKIGYYGSNRLHITGSMTNRLVHQWRSEEAGIMVGTNTALTDDPQLTNRLWTGNSPVRIIIDQHLRLPGSLQLFDGTVKTIVFNLLRHEEHENILFYQITEDVNIVPQVLNALYHLRILSVLIEGGAQLLQSFIDEGQWDEARILTNDQLFIESGVPSPVLPGTVILESIKKIEKDTVRILRRNKSS